MAALLALHERPANGAPNAPALWLLVCLLAAAGPAAALDITLDPNQPGRTFEGIGAVSAGASSRLLIDYPEPQRSQILDYLFKPNYGAALQHLKVEIGGEVNSTDGTEPTHMRTRSDQNYTRGYEWWLMQQAKARNPAVLLDCLAWGAPGWIGNGNYYSQDMCDYIVNFLKGAQTQYGLSYDFTGTHNEAAVNSTWIKQLRSTLDANGLQKVQLVAADEWGGAWNIVTNSSYGLLVDTALSNAVARIGAHYPQSVSPAAAQSCSQPLWASEDGIGGSTWAAARKLGKLFNRNYVTGKMTKTEIWSPIASYYDMLAAPDSGLMRANAPWSGNYQVAPAIWAAAHTTQFAFPGWKYLEGGASALLPSGGSVVALVSTNHSDYSIVVETFDATAAQTVTFHLTNGLSTAGLHEWQTSQTNQFVQVQLVPVLGGAFTCTFQPECIYTLTTTSGQAKGNAAPPAPAPFPLPFKDDFESYAPGKTPKYFSDQAGTFETFVRADGRGQCLRQVLPQVGIRWTAEWQPYTLLGDRGWADYDVSANVLIETNGGVVFVMGRVGSVPGFSDALPRGYWLALNNASAQWELHCSSNLLAAGAATIPTNTWLSLRLAMQGSSLRCYVDGALVTNVTDSTYASGPAGLGCGWHGAQFDDFTLRQLHDASLNLAPAATARASSVWQDDPTYAPTGQTDPLDLRHPVRVVVLAALLGGAHLLTAGPLFQQVGSTLVMSNGNVQVQYNLGSGRSDFYWQNSRKIVGFYAGVGLATYLTDTLYGSHTWTQLSSNQVVVTSTSAGLPAMKQYFVLDQANSFLTRVAVESGGTNSNWMGPLVVDTSGGVDIGSYTDVRALYVPFDNDHFVRYNAMPINSSSVGYEVGAFYDNSSRAGLVVGSVTHDTWKTGVYWSGSNNKLNQLNVFGGVTMADATWDVLPHGAVAGTNISSPTVFVGFGPDWRTLLESFADENAVVVPKVPWTNGVPFGWNSWYAFQTKLNYSNAVAVSDFIKAGLQPRGFGDNGTVYVNLDSYWDNMSSSQLVAFASHCHENGQKAGIYWSPWVWWGSPANISNVLVQGSSYRYSDIALRTPAGILQTNDGAIALDPTHPGTLQRVDYYVNQFLSQGYDFLKLDFLSHGAMEGVHYAPGVTTGIQAYNRGMQYLFNKANGRMFLSESIAPLFPYQYAHSRRIACDTANKIADTEYEMQSVSYGWWMSGRLYQFNDPDMMEFAGVTGNENQSRLISGAVSGTLFLNSDDLSSSTGQALALNCLTNTAINDVARIGQTFRPVEGNTGSSATDMLVMQNGTNWYLAVFNYTSSATNKVVDFTRAGLPTGICGAVDLWSGAYLAASGSLSVSLQAKQARLFKLAWVSQPLLHRDKASMQGTGGPPYGSYQLMASTNIALARSDWLPVGTGAFDASGGFSSAVTNNPSVPQMFFLLQVP